MQYRQLGSSLAITLALSTVFVADPVRAEGWEYSLAPYLWGAGLDGRLEVGPVTAPIDVSFSDILENLDSGLLAHFEATKDEGPWTILADLVFLELGTETTGAETEVEQTIFEVGGAYGVADDVEALFGARLVDIGTDVEIFGPLGGPLLSVESDLDWVDPFIGARWSPRINDTWSFKGRADVGGFGIGSELTWNAALTFLWQASDKVTVGLGYRLMDIDYEDEGPRFVYDVQLGGALVGVGFNF